MNGINTQRGISLLELLVGLAIFALIASVAMPTIIPDNTRHSIYNGAEEVRFTLQNLLRDSWLSGKSFQVIPATKGRWAVLVRQHDEWQNDHYLFENMDGFTFFVTTNDKGSEENFSQGGIYFLSSGEYTPFNLEIHQGSLSMSVVGDGVNDIEIK